MEFDLVSFLFGVSLGLILVFIIEYIIDIIKELYR